MFLQTGRQTQQFVFVTRRIQRHNVGKLRRSCRERTRLVKDYRINFCQRFQIAAALDEGAVFRSRFHTGKNGQRRCQPQCTGIVHHEHTGSTRQVAGQKKHKTGERKVIRNDGIGQAFGLTLYARLALLAGFDKFDNF